LFVEATTLTLATKLGQASTFRGLASVIDRRIEAQNDIEKNMYTFRQGTKKAVKAHVCGAKHLQGIYMRLAPFIHRVNNSAAQV
jgi:hypothetical protein